MPSIVTIRPPDFNPRSPHGERRQQCGAWTTSFRFQSTLPARGATGKDKYNQQQGFISIHAPRTGSDRRR